MKELQRLAGRVASLQRFILKSANKSAPFFMILKNPKDFKWTTECEETFRQLKSFFALPPILTRPTPGKVYLSVSQLAISAIIVQEEEKQQRPIYYTSNVMQGADVRYQMIEKLALALVTATRRLHPNFQSHQVVVRLDYPIKQVLRKPE